MLQNGTVAKNAALQRLRRGQLTFGACNIEGRSDAALQPLLGDPDRLLVFAIDAR